MPGEKRLAVHVEDHPIEYNKFEGTIPEGPIRRRNGDDLGPRRRGVPKAIRMPGYRKGHLSFRLEGEKLHGGWHLVRMRQKGREKQEPWLLIKAHDETARAAARSRHPGGKAAFGGDRPQPR